MNKKIVALILIILFASSCSNHNLFAPNKKVFRFLNKKFANDSPIFKKGLLDGCETGFSLTGFSNVYYSTFYKFKYDYNSTNKKYHRAFSVAFKFCRQYSVGTLHETKMRAVLPGEKPGGNPYARILPLDEASKGHSIFGNVFNIDRLGGGGFDTF